MTRTRTQQLCERKRSQCFVSVVSKQAAQPKHWMCQQFFSGTVQLHLLVLMRTEWELFIGITTLYIKF